MCINLCHERGTQFMKKHWVLELCKAFKEVRWNDKDKRYYENSQTGSKY